MCVKFQLSIEHTVLQNQQQTQEESSQLYTHLNHVFLRDWTSDYTFDLD